MAEILFLAPVDLGEAVLATAAWDAAVQPGDAVTLVCRPAVAPLFRGAPGVERTHVLTNHAGLGARWALWLELSRKRFDLAIDARGGLLGKAAPASRRVALKPNKFPRHRVEDWAEALDAKRPLAPKLWIDPPARERAAAIAESGALLVLAPGGMDDAKRWPAERFAAVARRLAGGPLAQAAILVVGAGRRDVPVTRAIVSSLDADGVAARDLGADLDLLTIAAVLERATLCIGNDNAITHIAAAAGAATLTLFGPTDERIRAPYGPRARTLRGRSLEEIASTAPAESAMDAMSIDAVEAAALDVLQAGGLR